MSKSLSVIMPNYNHGEYIKFALDALVNQTEFPTEIIIIDDASSDNSLEIIQKYIDKYPYITLFRNIENQGVVKTLNMGLSLAKGDYILFTAADDVLYPDFIRKTKQALQLYPEAGLCSSRTRMINQKGEDLGPHEDILITRKLKLITPSLAQKIFVNLGNWIQSNTTIYRRDYLLKEGGFPVELKSYADSYINIVISIKYGACYLPEYLGKWRRLNTSFSHQNSHNAESFYAIMTMTEQHFLTKNTEFFSEKFIKSWKKQMICQFLIDFNQFSSSQCLSFIKKVNIKKSNKIRNSVITLRLISKILFITFLKPRYLLLCLKKLFMKEII